MVNIGANAFYNCTALKDVTIKNNTSNPLKTIGSSAFGNCTNLNHITVYGNPTITAKAIGFNGSKKIDGFYLAGEPNSTVQKYAETNGFTFANANTGEIPNITTTTTTATTKATTTTTTTTTQKPTGNVVYGDANCDGSVDMSDAVIIMQALANPNKYGLEGSDPKHLTAQGRKNGDVDLSSTGITSNDALRIQQYLLKKITSLDPTK